MKRGFLILILVALATLAVWLSTFQVREGETVIVARLGNPRATVERPGLYFKLPAPLETVIRVDRRIHVLDPEPNEYLTADKKNVIVDCFLAWTVKDPLKYWVTVSTRGGAELRLTDVLRSVVGDVLGAHAFAALVADEPHEIDIRDVSLAITEAASVKAERDFGIAVTAVRIKRLNFPLQNKEAVFRRMEQERESIATAIRSEGTEQYDRIKAEADREEAELLAEANRRAEEMRGQAEAEATRLLAEAYGRDPELFRMLRELEILKKSLKDDSLLILPADHELLKVLTAPAPAGTKNGDEDP